MIPLTTEDAADGAERKARAFAPAHITGFFKIYADGSTGAGLNLAQGAETTVHVRGAQLGETKEPEVLINGEPLPAPVSLRVIERYRPALGARHLLVKHETAFPVGYGLGMSGAGVFSLSLALNQALGCGFSYKECQQVAGAAEIACGTGLGSVMSQEFHGVMIGLPPYPSRSIRNINCALQHVVCAFFEPIETATIIQDARWKERINEVGEYCMTCLAEEPTVEKLILLSRHFALETGLAGPGVRAAMAQIPEASMAMLGQTVFAITEDVDRVKGMLLELSPRVMVTKIATHGACLL